MNLFNCDDVIICINLKLFFWQTTDTKNNLICNLKCNKQIYLRGQQEKDTFRQKKSNDKKCLKCPYV